MNAKQTLSLLFVAIAVVMGRGGVATAEEGITQTTERVVKQAPLPVAPEFDREGRRLSEVRPDGSRTYYYYGPDFTTAFEFSADGRFASATKTYTDGRPPETVRDVVYFIRNTICPGDKTIPCRRMVKEPPQDQQIGPSLGSYLLTQTFDDGTKVTTFREVFEKVKA